MTHDYARGYMDGVVAAALFYTPEKLTPEQKDEFCAGVNAAGRVLDQHETRAIGKD